MPKRKHYYHKGHFIMVTERKLDTPAVCLLELKKGVMSKKQEDWYNFIDTYGYRNRPTAVPDYENILAIGACLLDTNASISGYYYQNIYQLFEDNYNPYSDRIPLDRLPDDLADIIRKKQSYIKNMYHYRKEYEDLNLLVQYNRRDMQNLTTLDLRNYEYVIRLSGENTYIYSNNFLEHEDIVQQVVQSLNQNEGQEIWIQDKTDKRLIKNTKKTKLNFQNYHSLFCIFSC